AAQREEVIHMTAHGIEIRLPAWRKKRRIKVDSHKSAGFTDGAKLCIGEIAPVWAQGGRIGMAGHHRLLGKIHEIPKGALREMAHVEEDPQALCPADKFPSLGGQSPAVLDGAAGQGIIL